jgi:hypothetical protein
MRKARPKAAAACGTDRSGEMRCWIREKAGVPAQPATKSITSPSDASVANRPVARLVAADMTRPG